MKYSEYIHNDFQLGDFKLTGDFVKDADRFMESVEIPSEEAKKIIRNTAMFRFSFGETFTVHNLTDGVVEKIKRTKTVNK